MSGEHEIVRQLFDRLVQAPAKQFPEARGRIDAPVLHGVYIIYGPRGKVLHVGRTYRGKDGLRQRLKNHLHAGSSFTVKYFSGDGSQLRRTHKYRYLVVNHARRRALLEAYAVGCLCPAHLGLGDNLMEPDSFGS